VRESAEDGEHTEEPQHHCDATLVNRQWMRRGWEADLG
jgi:hypothetical protein